MFSQEGSGRAGKPDRVGDSSRVASILLGGLGSLPAEVACDLQAPSCGSVLGQERALPQGYAQDSTRTTKNLEALGPPRPQTAEKQACVAIPEMSSTVESLISELDLAISACVGQDLSSTESSDALEALKGQVQRRSADVDFDGTSLRRITGGLSLPRWVLSSQQAWQR